MKSFVQRHSDSVMGTLNGFDRLLFRGTLRRIANAAGLGSFLSYMNVLLKDAGNWMQHRTKQVRAASKAVAEDQGRPVKYLPDPSTRKEEVAREMARRDGIEQGLVCVLTSVDPCWSFDIRKNREQKKLELVSRYRKCLHLYHYFQDPQLGLMHMRVQSWFPFTCWCCINGREWLARQMDQAGIGYRRRENCFVWIEDVASAQALADEQLKTNWAGMLERVRRLIHPAHERIFAAYPMDYYWSCQESEWATDLMFKSSRRLAQLYPQLIRHGMQNLSSSDVMRFLGKKTSASDGVHGNFTGEVVSDIRRRPEGLRIRHRVRGNSVKMYDKQDSVLRVETTITDPRDMKVYRGTEAKPGDLRWQRMRKGVADMHRRAQVSQSSNERYLEAMASVQETTPLGELTEPLCQSKEWKGTRVRGLNPLGTEDAKLLETIARGEFVVNGFRNRDLRQLLYADASADAAEAKRRAGVVTRKLRMLRAHGLIRKVPRTHRYLVSDAGRRMITALLSARQADTETLMKAA